MAVEYATAVEIKRRPWQRRIEVFSPKLRRRLGSDLNIDAIAAEAGAVNIKVDTCLSLVEA